VVTRELSGLSELDELEDNRFCAILEDIEKGFRRILRSEGIGLFSH